MNMSNPNTRLIGDEMGIFSDDFASIFSAILDRTGVTCHQINKYTGLDPGYLSRLRNGQKRRPSAEVLVRISVALAHHNDKVTQHDIERLFESIGCSLKIRAYAYEISSNHAKKLI